MTQIDMRRLEVAIKYIERIADGRNPVNNRPVEDDAVLNDPNVIRCMFFVREVLNAVKENDGMISGRASKTAKSPFPFDCLSKFAYVDDTSISHFLNRLKDLSPDPNVKGIHTKIVTDWLKSKGYLIDIPDEYTGKFRTEATESGIAFGLYMQERMSAYGQVYRMVMYSQKAQEFLVAHLEEIVGNRL